MALAYSYQQPSAYSSYTKALQHQQAGFGSPYQRQQAYSQPAVLGSAGMPVGQWCIMPSCICSLLCDFQLVQIMYGWTVNSICLVLSVSDMQRFQGLESHVGESQQGSSHIVTAQLRLRRDLQTGAWRLPNWIPDRRLPPAWPSDGPKSACFAGTLTLLGLAANRLPPCPAFKQKAPCASC